MNANVDNDIAQAERGWGAIPDVTREESPETALAVKAHGYFQAKILLAQGIKARADELKLNGQVTSANYDQAKIVTGLCRKARGDIERNRKLANEDALAWQRAINERAGELKAEVDAIDGLYRDGVKAIDDEAARIKREAEEAELRAKIEAERAEQEAARKVEAAQRAAEAEANRKEAERLAGERAAMELERQRIVEEQATLNAELNRKMAAERAAFLAEQKIANDARLVAERQSLEERQMIEQEFAAWRKQKADAEAEAQRIELAKAEEFQREQAAERERLRLEAIQPDVAKVNKFGSDIAKFATKFPTVKSDEATAVITRAIADLGQIAAGLRQFGNT